MENIVREESLSTPKIEFKTNGILNMEGRLIPENAAQLFHPLIHFVSELNQKEVLFNVKLDYFNTAASKQLWELFSTLEENERIDQINVNWHYEEGDEDSLEMAELYQESLQRISFQYFQFAEVA